MKTSFFSLCSKLCRYLSFGIGFDFDFHGDSFTRIFSKVNHLIAWSIRRNGILLLKCIGIGYINLKAAALSAGLNFYLIVRVRL